MKKAAGLFISIILLLVPLSSMEWGGLITEDLGYETKNFSSETNRIKQSNSASLWMTGALVPDGIINFAAQASGKYFLTSKNDAFVFTPIINLDLLKFSGNLRIAEGVLNYSVGRFAISDLTGKIFSQTNDGMLLKYSMPSFEANAYIGYTGYLNAMTVAMLSNEHKVHTVDGSVYVMAHSYMPVCLSMEVPSLFLNQTFNVQLSGFFDMEETKYNRYYGTFSLNGPIVGSVYYSLLTTFALENFDAFSNYSALSIQIFPISFFTLKLNAEYASGNQLIFKPFVTFTSNTAYNSYLEPELSGVIMPNVDFIFLWERFYASLNGKVVLGYPENEIIFQGLNFTANMYFNIFTDLQLGLSAIYYHDIINAGEMNKASLNVNVSLSF